MFNTYIYILNQFQMDDEYFQQTFYLDFNTVHAANSTFSYKLLLVTEILQDKDASKISGNDIHFPVLLPVAISVTTYILAIISISSQKIY